MSFGTTSQIINAARLKISRGAVEVRLASDVRITKSRVLDRTNTRAGALDTGRWALTELEFEAVLTELLVEQIKDDINLSDESALDYTNWTVQGLAISGTPADNVSETLNCAVINYDFHGPENGPAKARIRLRVQGSAT